MIDQRLRKLLHDRAEEFSMPATLPTAVVRRARWKVAARVGGGIAAVTLAASLWAVGTVDQNQTSDGGTDPPVRLVTYVSADDPPGREGPAGGPEDAASLRRFADCMRGAGFVVPDPVLSERGWTIPVEAEPEVTPAWREAAFVRCRPRNVHLSGNLVVGGRTEGEVDTFWECMRTEGYGLPPPERSGSEWVFDLRGSGFEVNTDPFVRAALVTCAPDLR